MEFIDELVEGGDTVLTISNLANFSAMNALHQELESRQISPIELMSFDENSCQWSELMLVLKKEYT